MIITFEELRNLLQFIKTNEIRRYEIEGTTLILNPETGVLFEATEGILSIEKVA